MRIEYFHASKYGNGAMVAEEFMKQMAARGVTVNVHHIREARPKELPPADLYLFSSPGRMGKPIGGMRRFLKKVAGCPPGTKYAILTTEGAPRPDKKTGRMPTEEELAQVAARHPDHERDAAGQGPGQGRRGQGPGDRDEGTVGGGLAEEGGGLRRPDPDRVVPALKRIAGGGQGMVEKPFRWPPLFL